MTPLLAQILIGWSAILGSLLLSVAGLYWRKAWLPVAGAVLTLGFAWYLTRWPLLVFNLIGYALPLTHLGAAAGLHYRRPALGWALLLPHMLVALWMAVAVLTQGV